MRSWMSKYLLNSGHKCDLILWPLWRGTGQIHLATSTNITHFCEYFVRAEARRESWMDCICWLEQDWILQVNSNLKQYCTKHNECESEPICSQNERSSTFSHCHTLNFHSFLKSQSHFILILNVDLLYPIVHVWVWKMPIHSKREEKWERSALTPVFSLCIVFFSVICWLFGWFFYPVVCVFSYVYVYIIFSIFSSFCGRFTVFWLLVFFILSLYSNFLNKCSNKISDMWN